MKKITEMTHDEIIALDEADIERLVDLACAEEGIPLMDLPPEEPAKPKWNNTPNAFEIASWIFNNRDAAESVQACAQANLDSILKIHYQDADNTSLKIEEVVFLTEEQVAQRNKKEKEFNKAHAIWRDTYAQYSNLCHKRAVIDGPIRLAWREANKLESVRDMLQKQALQYLELAEGSVEIAVKFLQKAFPEALVAVKDIFDPVKFITAARFPVDGEEEAE